ncbi:SDR family oxidoreductase [Eubacterium callanderi]|uniref:SDR family oxidoreductase n=1 Tax=Eubacterium callanderi TaxID=53442 RepID=UPI00399C0494
MKKTILVIGASGMVGHVISLYFKEKGYEVATLTRSQKIFKDTILLDLKDELTLKTFLEQNDFDIIVNCSAILVHQSEESKNNAVFINSYIPHFLEAFYKDSATKIIQLSSDGVFNGDKSPYEEDRKPDTTTFYGKTKILGELDNPKDLTIRATFFGPNFHNGNNSLFHWFMTQKGLVKGFEAVILNGVTSLEAAEFIEYAIENELTGIKHLGTSNAYSKYELLQNIKKVFNKTEIQIIKDTEIQSDHTLVLSDYYGYSIKTLEEQLLRLHDWMENHPQIYTQYFED